ncbi:MAG TPA: integrase core domain-containing protein [bacterium]|nr:integrase core domain-containing protein [bacterium]HPQ19325.1 integrase core domain-containing protein [bacterium]
MNSTDKALDNIFVERFFGTIKYENIYLYNYESMFALFNGLNCIFYKYNSLREHSAIANLCPDQVYFMLTRR